MVTLLQEITDTRGDRVAIGHPAETLSYRQLRDQAAALAGCLRARQVKRLVLCHEPDIVLPVALFAAAWSGTAYLPVNYRLPDNELRWRVQQTAPALAVTSASDAERLKGLDGLETMTVEALHQDPAAGAQPADLGDWPTNPDTIAVLLHTSGTTGPPKTAVLRHRHLLSYVTGMVEPASASADESHIMAVPPYHIASVAAQLSQVYAGRRIVPLARFDPDEWIDLVKAEGVTHAMLVPTMLTRIVDALQRRSEVLQSVRFVSYGGGKSHIDVVHKALEVFPEAGFMHAYGLTEASSTVCVLGPEEHRRCAASDDPFEQARLTSAGRPLTGVEVSVRNADGSEALDGRSGEIWVRGGQVSGEYNESGVHLDSNGWFLTSDLGHLDQDGYLWVQGRSDDVIIRGGENLSPGEIEETLMSHPDVVDAAVFGMPSREWGEEVMACVVTRQSAPATKELVEELIQHVKTQLRSARVPAHLEFVDALPYNDTGKLLRRQLRERFKSLDDPVTPFSNS